MAFSFVRQASNTGAASAPSLAVAVPAAGHAAGNLLLAFVNFEYYTNPTLGGSVTITDNGGNTWTRRYSNSHPHDNDRFRVFTQIWSCVPTVALVNGNNVTLNCDLDVDPTMRAMLVAEFNGPNAHDSNGNASNQGTGTAIDIDTDRALSASEELRVAAIGAVHAGAGVDLFTPDTNWNALNPLSVSNASDTWQLHSLYRIVTSGSVHPGGDFAASQWWGGVSGVFYATAPAPNLSRNWWWFGKH